MIRILKLSLTVLITAGLLAVSTWFFLRNSILEKFINESLVIQQQINTITDPESGQENMEKYLAGSGKLIHNHFPVPLFPLIKEMEKDDMEKTVSERMGDFKRKLEQMDRADPEARVVTYHFVVLLFNELFPDKRSVIEKTLKITIKAEMKNYLKEDEMILRKARDISGSSKKTVNSDIVKKEKNPSRKIKTEIEKKNTPISQSDKKNAKEEIRIISLSRAGDHIGVRVSIYLKTGRRLEGFIKMLDEIYLHLDVEFKGGIFTAKVLKRDIDEIVKVKESTIFKYLREQNNGS